MLHMFSRELRGARLQYTAVDKDPQLLAAPRGGARTWCGDAAAAVRALGPQSLVVGCSILDLIDVVELSEALRTHQPGALLYFPIHYAGSTSFQGPLAKGARALSESYDESLETRGQVGMQWMHGFSWEIWPEMAPKPRLLPAFHP